MEETKKEKKTLHSLIIHPGIEPGVIDNAMLTRCILEYGPKEEAGRLFAEEGVHIDEAKSVRLEFQNILRIDHLWMLKSLTKLTLAHNVIEKIENLEQLTLLNELDLSFNQIERLENLDTLVNLEVLTVFHNKIRKLENMDTLENLLVFSIGDNLIEDYKEGGYKVSPAYKRLIQAVFRLVVVGTSIRACLALMPGMTYIIHSLPQNSTAPARRGELMFYAPMFYEDPVLPKPIFDLICTYHQVIYLRMFRKLRSVSFKGNPCCDDPMAYHFLRAALTRVTYIDYRTVTIEDRENGQAFFRGLLRKLDDAEEISEKERIAKEEYDARVKFYALSFVEYLSGPELLESMFEKDPDGSLLLKVGGELVQHYDEYKEQYVETMAALVEFAQGAYKDRQNEIALFKNLVDSALEESVKTSKQVVEEFEEKKVGLHDQLNELIMKYNSKSETLEQLEPRLVDLTDAFNELVYELWKKLMTIEMNLYEQCEDSRVQFAVNIEEMITKLLENSRMAFGAWREHESSWSTRQFESLTKLLGNKLMLGDCPQDLFDVMMDRDMMMNLVAQSSDNHMRFIDAREDLLMTRANNWREDLVQSTNDNEVKRNRDRILEINYFIDNQREDWQDMQAQLGDTVDPETAALLGDDFLNY